MSSLIERIKQLIARVMGRPVGKQAKKEALVTGLMAALNMTAERELGCAEVFEVVDLYAEAVVEGKDVGHLMPMVHHHIAMCHECRAEFEMLLEMMQVELR